MSELQKRIAEIGEETKAAIQRHSQTIISEVDRHVAAVNSLVTGVGEFDDAAQRLIEGFQKQMAEINDGAATAMLEKSKELLSAIPGNSKQNPAATPL